MAQFFNLELLDRLAGLFGRDVGPDFWLGYVLAAIVHLVLLIHVVAVGAKGCVTFSPTPVRNYRDFLAIDDRWSHCHWLYQHNGGVFLPPWGKMEQWTLSVQHTAADLERAATNIERFARDLRR